MGMQSAPAHPFYDFCLDDDVPDDYQLQRMQNSSRIPIGPRSLRRLATSEIARPVNICKDIDQSRCAWDIAHNQAGKVPGRSR